MLHRSCCIDLAASILRDFDETLIEALAFTAAFTPEALPNLTKHLDPALDPARIAAYLVTTNRGEEHQPPRTREARSRRPTTGAPVARRLGLFTTRSSGGRAECVTCLWI